MIFFNKIVEHFYGIVGQITAGLPLLLVTAIISNNIGLLEAGQFTVTVGLSSAIYTIFLWGFRPLIVVNRFQDYNKSTFFFLRLVFLFLFSIFLILFSIKQNYLITLSLIIIIYKCCDGFIDLNFGFIQTKNSSNALKEFCKQHSYKIMLLILILLIFNSFFVNHIYLGIIFSGLISLIYIVRNIISRINISTLSIKDIESIKIVQILSKSTPFAISASVCGLLTASPRFMLDRIYDGELLGVIGISLSIGTLFGMIFNTTWARYFPNFSIQKNQMRYIFMFILENLFLSILLLVISCTILPHLISYFFDIDIIIYSNTLKSVLIGCVFFSCGMSTVNLYKITNFPIFESLSYGCALLFFLYSTFLESIELNNLLVYCGLIMQFLGILSILILKK
tara:strand:+ start:7 stop:1191 length:1185 start_codon:yes stop_codon:yes gene_type:complete